MHMTFHTYRTIKRSLMQTLQARPGGHQKQHINTLANPCNALFEGICKNPLIGRLAATGAFLLARAIA